MNDDRHTKVFIIGWLLGVLFSHSGLLGFVSGAVTATFLIKNNNEAVVCGVQATRAGFTEIVEHLKGILFPEQSKA